MRSFWSDPYLWVHLAGLAVVPLCLELCLLGLAVGDPILPVGLEFILVAAIGIVPVLWMQWNRPFSIFSLPAVALRPDRLTLDQRKLLRLFQAPRQRILAGMTAIALLLVLWQLYRFSPIVSPLTATDQRWVGLAGAAIAFLAANLFVQVPVSVLSVLLTSELAFAAAEPYPTERIPGDFLLPGVQVKRLLPELVDAQPRGVPLGVNPLEDSDDRWVDEEPEKTDIDGV